MIELRSAGTVCHMGRRLDVTLTLAPLPFRDLCKTYRRSRVGGDLHGRARRHRHCGLDPTVLVLITARLRGNDGGRDYGDLQDCDDAGASFYGYCLEASMTVSGWIRIDRLLGSCEL